MIEYFVIGLAVGFGLGFFICAFMTWWFLGEWKIKHDMVEV